MAKGYITNRALSKYYGEDMLVLGNEAKQKEIVKIIGECPLSFHEYYLQHRGILSSMYTRKECRKISAKTLSILEGILDEKVGKPGKVEEKRPETVKNKSGAYLIGRRHYRFRI